MTEEERAYLCLVLSTCVGSPVRVIRALNSDIDQAHTAAGRRIAICVTCSASLKRCHTMRGTSAGRERVRLSAQTLWGSPVPFPALVPYRPRQCKGNKRLFEVPV